MVRQGETRRPLEHKFDSVKDRLGASDPEAVKLLPAHVVSGR